MAEQNEALSSERIQAEIARLIAETSKINSENKYYPIVITASATLAVVGTVAAAVKFWL